MLWSSSDSSGSRFTIRAVSVSNSTIEGGILPGDNDSGSIFNTRAVSVSIPTIEGGIGPGKNEAVSSSTRTGPSRESKTVRTSKGRVLESSQQNGTAGIPCLSNHAARRAAVRIMNQLANDPPSSSACKVATTTTVPSERSLSILASDCTGHRNSTA